VATPEPKETKKTEPLVVVQRDATTDKAAETLRKRKEQAYFAALSSPLVAKRGGAAAGAKQGEPQPDQPGPGSGSLVKNTINSSANTSAPGPDGYDPAADVDKEGFFTRADTRDGEGGWLSRHTREAGRKYEVKTGTVIPAVMVTGINSDLPGVMIAQISQTVFDTATGKYLLFPQGAKLYGVYDARVIYGQRRVLVAWNRVVFPDGSSVTLGAMPGADMSGYSGFEDQVDNHYFRIFGSAVLMSAITGGISYAVDNNSNSSYGSDKTTFQDAMSSALAAQVGAAAMRLLEKNLNIKPTLEIRPGYQFNVVATKDIAFKGPYREEHYGTVRP
jgi:type IV secretion system protein VirB10